MRPRRYGFDPESDDNIECSDTDTEGEGNFDSDASSDDSFVDDNNNSDFDASSVDRIEDDMAFVEPGSEDSSIVEIEFRGKVGWNNII